MITATLEPHIMDAHRREEPIRDGGDGITRTAVLAELDKILSSATFIRSKRLGRFLRFTVEQCLDGRQNALKEYLVGVEVFNKMETFDPRIDSIVRVEARRLRSKLERYYQTEGRDDQIIVQFRKGSYVPLLFTRDQINAMRLSDDFPGSRVLARTLAVSEFSCLGLEQAHADFCKGLTEDLISGLTKIPQLRVAATQSVLGNGHANPDYVLEGSVRKQGERLRIAVQLIDVATHVYVWSETYERDLADGFAVQDEISRAIVGALRKEFQGGTI